MRRNVRQTSEPAGAAQLHGFYVHKYILPENPPSPHPRQGRESREIYGTGGGRNVRIHTYKWGSDPGIYCIVLLYSYPLASSFCHTIYECTGMYY